MADKKTVLITGASQGIGYELSRCFARDGYRLVLVSRNAAKLRAVAQELGQTLHAEVETMAKDLGQRQAPLEIYDELRQKNIPVDILVNNAGFGLQTPFQDSDLQEELDMIEVNVVSVVQLTKLFAKDMVRRNFGKILNIGSISSFKPGPFMAVYYGTKFFLLAFTEALAGELKSSGVTVSLLCPGPTETGFQERARTPQTAIMRATMMSARAVAEIGYRGLMRNEMIIIPGIKNKILVLLCRYLPRRLALELVLKVQHAGRA